MDKGCEIQPDPDYFRILWIGDGFKPGRFFRAIPFLRNLKPIHLGQRFHFTFAAIHPSNSPEIIFFIFFRVTTDDTRDDDLSDQNKKKKEEYNLKKHKNSLADAYSSCVTAAIMMSLLNERH